MVVEIKMNRFLATLPEEKSVFGNPLNYGSNGVFETWNSGPRVPGIEHPKISSFSNDWFVDNFIYSRCPCGRKCQLNYVEQ